MEDRKFLFWRSITVLMGGVIGVGIYGLPYVFARSGVVVGLIHLVLLAVVMATVMRAFADLILLTPGRPRLAGVIGRYLGQHWAWLTSALFLVAAWGALLAYIIVGGTFMQTVLSPLLGGTYFWYQLVFFLIGSCLLIGGLGLVSRLEVMFISLMALLIAIIFLGALPYINPAHLTTIDLKYVFLPFGVVMFALGGLGVVPEMSDLLGVHRQELLKRSIFWGIVAVAIIYALFAVIVVSVSGLRTSPEGIIGLADFTGSWIAIIGAVIGMVTVMGSFTMLGTEIISLLTIDFKKRYLLSWLAAISVPLILFLSGERNFIKVIGFTGGVITSFIGLLIIACYLRAKADPSIPKRALSVPNWALYGCGFIYLVAALSTLFNR